MSIKSNLPSGQKANFLRYDELFRKISLTPVEQTEFDNLALILDPYLITANDFNSKADDSELSSYINISQKATQAHAEGQTDNTTFMTPLRTAQEVEAILNTASINQPVVGYGMNNKITHAGDNPVFPTINIQGMDYVNLLGKDGDCEDISKWTNSAVTTALDNTTKILGTNSIKLTLTTSNGEIYKNILSQLITSKYYMISAYIRNGNSTSGIGLKVNCSGDKGDIFAAKITTTTWTRQIIKVQPSDIDGAASVYIGANIIGSVGQYGFVDGVMINEISASDYALTDAQLLAKYPYIESYATLQNPYFEARRDNLVLNGNGEYGISYLNKGSTANPLFDANEKAFKLIQVDGNSTLTQRFNIAPSTQYSYSYNIKYIDGIGNQSVLVYRLYDKSNTLINQYSTFLVGGFSTTIYRFVSTTFITPSNAYSIELDLITYGDFRNYYIKEISLIEGASAPSTYKSCDLKRFVIEGQFTKDDILKIENGQITGQLWWKHKTLYGRDFAWIYYDDQAGYKRISLTDYTIQAVTTQGIGTLVKPLGDIYVHNNSVNVTDVYGWNGSSNILMCVKDSDTGWGEAYVPSSDEVKAFMNGWVMYDSNTYTANQTGRKWTGTGTKAWSSINNDSTYTGDINYAKSTVVPNYDGYRLHYKLTNPEPIVDTNCHLHGDMWSIEKGDNYITFDSGIVLGEINIPVLANGSYYINRLYTDGNNSPCKYQVNQINTVYRNGIYEINATLETPPNGNRYGLVGAIIPQTNYDANVTYTVDYQILKTLHAQSFTSLTIAYPQGMVQAIQTIAEVVETKQSRHPILDRILDTFKMIGSKLFISGNVGVLGDVTIGGGLKVGGRPIFSTETINYYVNPQSGSDFNDGLSSSKPFSTFAKAMSLVPYVIKSEHQIIIRLIGTFTEPINISNVNASIRDGFVITKDSVTPTINSHIDVKNVNGIFLSNLFVSHKIGTECINFYGCRDVLVGTSTFERTGTIGALGTDVGIGTSRCTGVELANNTFTNSKTSECLYIVDSTVISYNSTGLATRYGIAAWYSTILVKTGGNQPTGTVQNEYMGYGGIIK